MTKGGKRVSFAYIILVEPLYKRAKDHGINRIQDKIVKISSLLLYQLNPFDIFAKKWGQLYQILKWRKVTLADSNRSTNKKI